MPASKKKRLPKDFEQQLEGGDLEALKRVFESCEIDARDNNKYSQKTALMMPECPDDLARWLLAQGADINAVDYYGSNALHIASHLLYRPRDLELLIKSGCTVGTRDHYGNTPLHAAADAKHIRAVQQLITAGAEVNAINREGLTPLELGLRGCANIKIVDMVPTAKALLAAGARTTPAMSEYVSAVGKNFEFHRAAFAKDSVESTSKAMEELCKLFNVSPPPRRVTHDGSAPIITKADSWQQQFEELWSLLVPSNGAAATIQGEVIRISGRISDEICRNGGTNWDSDYKQMAQAFLSHLQSGQSLDADTVREAGKIIAHIVKCKGNDDSDGHERLAELAVEWVRLNPKPVKLGNVAYDR